MSAFTPDQLRHFFYGAVVAIPACAFFWFSFKNGSSMESGFRVRESQKKHLHRSVLIESAVTQSHSKPTSKAAPLRLGGISIQGAPHEILGIAPTANVVEINKAYRELMKRYHPDKVGRPGSREWKDAQQIAEALNRAKTALLTPSKS